MHRIGLWLQKHKVELLIFIGTLLQRIFLLVAATFLANGTLAQDLVETVSNSWKQWDSNWYLSIITHGYDRTFPAANTVCTQLSCQRNYAFFPLYPLIVQFISNVFHMDPVLAGVLFSNIFFVLSVVVFYKLVKAYWNEKVALYSTIFLIFFPLTYVFSAMMTESLFFLLLISGYYAAKKNQWILAGILGALLSATRSVGILFSLSLLLMWLENSGYVFSFKNIQDSLKKFIKTILSPKLLFSILLVPVGLVLFMSFLHFHVGDAFVFMKIQKYWGRPIYEWNPILLFLYSFINYDALGSLGVHLYYLLLAGFLMFAMVYGYIKVKVPLSQLFLFAWLYVPLSTGTMMSFERYAAVIFPFYIIMGYFLMKYRWLFLLYVIISPFVLVLMGKLFIHQSLFTV